MKKYYTQLFLIFIFSGVMNHGFSEALIRQNEPLDIPSIPLEVANVPLLSGDNSWKKPGVNEQFVSSVEGHLSPGPAYYHRLTPETSEPENRLDENALLAAPNPPTRLSATGLDGSTIRLTWSHDMVNVEKFVIERLQFFSYQQIAEVAATATSYDDTDLLPLVNYNYRIKAINGLEESVYSNTASSFTAIIPTVPAAPSNLTASTVTSASIELKWVDNADNEDNYVVERGQAEAGPFEETLLPADTESMTDVDLVPNTTYFYKVKARNVLGSSDYTATIEASTLDEAPAAPSGLTATPLSSNSIRLQWADNATNETGFVLERAPTTAEADFVPVTTTTADAVSFDDTGLSPNTSYYYRLKAINAVDDSDYTSTVEAKTLDVAPAPPSEFEITGKTSSTITLSWKDDSNNETGFVLEKSTISASEGFESLTTTVANTTTYEATNLTPNTTYYFRIKAINAVGESNFVPASGKTNDVAPVAPSGLQIAGKTSKTITLRWSDNSDNETGFVVERSSTSASAGFVELKTTAANAVTFEDTGLSSNTTYYYRVKARNAVGDSEYISVSGKTDDVAPKAPSGLQVTYKDAHQAKLKWTDNSINETNFVLERSTTSATEGFAVRATLDANTTSYDDTGLTSNTTYYYRVQAKNAIGGSEYSNNASLKTDVDLPLSPSGLTASDITTSSIQLSWTDNSSNESGFILERSLQSGSGFVKIEELPADNTTYLDEALAPNTTYFYRVISFNKDGVAESYSNTIGVTTKRESGAPAPPSLLKATAITTFQINLTWQDNADNETSYIVERSETEHGPFTVVTSNLPANTTFYENTGLKANTPYYYKVKAKNIDGTVESNVATAKTLANPSPPQKPSGLSAVAVSTVQINLTWIDNSNSETNFTIQRADEMNGTFKFIASVGANVTSYQNFGLEADKTYYYKVRAESGDGVSEFSKTDNATTFQLPKPPSAPLSLDARGVSTTQINLTWIDNSNSETAFVIERANTEGGNFEFIAAVGANVTSYPNTGLAPNARYYYKVRAVNSDGTSGYSNTVSAVTLNVGMPPVPPTNLVANGVSTTQINLTWEDNSDSETNFEIQRASAEEGPFTFLANVPANQEFYENTGLSANTTYYYRVRSSNREGNSSPSNIAQGTTSEVPQAPEAPDGLTALAVSTTQITLRWNDKAFNETNYEIERSIDSVKFDRVGSVSANDTVFQNFGLEKSTKYFYRVRAQNEDGVSEYSNVASAITLLTGVPPIAPSNLFVKPLSQSVVELSWIDNSDNEQEFKVQRAELQTEGQAAADFVTVEELPANANNFIDEGLKPNTIYRYRIQAANSDGTAYSNEFTIITSVGGNPVIITLSNSYPRFFSNQDEDTVVSITLAEPELYESALFYYRGLTEGVFKTDIPVEINGNVYSVRISRDHLDAMGVEYYFEAKNSEGSSAVSAKGFTHWKFENPGLTLSDLKAGESLSDYQMISIPLVLDQRRVVDVLEDDLGSYDPSKWRLFHYEDGAMLERGAFIDILPGESYWLIMKQEDTINTGAGNVVEAHSGEPFKLELNEGWNQIGNPYMFDISWNEVMQANDNPQFVGPLISYDGTYVESQTLGVFKGAYVHSGEATTIVFPIGVRESGSTGRFMTAESGKLQTEKQTTSGWDIDFALSSDELVYNLAGLGMHSEASLSKDRYDRIALPRLPAYLDLNFEHPEYFSPQFTKDIVPLQDAYVWEMQVVSSQGNKPVTISWEKPEHLPEGKNLILFDPVRRRQIDMKSVGKYEVTGEVRLQAYYGDDEFIAKNLNVESIYIGAVYPNPFVEQFAIPLALPESKGDYAVDVVLYNNVGKQIIAPLHFTVSDGFQDIHLPQNRLSGLNDGLYFYKIKISQQGDILKEEVGRIIKK